MQIFNSSTYSIIQGSRTDAPANPFIVRLKTDPVTMDPFDLTAVTALTCCFKNQDGTDLVVSLGSGITVVGNPILGKLQIALTNVQTALLLPVDGATLELTITLTGAPFKVQIPEAYSVIESDC